MILWYSLFSESHRAQEAEDVHILNDSEHGQLNVLTAPMYFRLLGGKTNLGN